jgi:hypothetical protein
MLKNGLREQKFPENKKINQQLIHGDREKIAQYSKYTVSTIRDMMYGYRRITNRAGKAIIRLFEERKKMTEALNEIANQNNDVL